MDSVNYDFHSRMAVDAPGVEARRLHKRICLLVEYAPAEGSPDAYVALAEVSLTEARIHALNGDRAGADAAMRESDRFTDLATGKQSRWRGVPVNDDFVPEAFRNECGFVRRTIERVVGSTRNTKRYIQTAPGLTKDHRRQMTEIYDMASGGVHHGHDGVTLVFDTEAAMDFLRNVEHMMRSKPDWRTRAETNVFKPLPAAFQDTLKMRSCRAKVQTATRASGGGW